MDSENKERAVSMLSKKEEIPLSMTNASQILVDELTDVNILLEKAAQKEDARASQREKEAAP